MPPKEIRMGTKPPQRGLQFDLMGGCRGPDDLIKICVQGGMFCIS